MTKKVGFLRISAIISVLAVSLQFIFAPVTEVTAAETQKMFRLYNPNSGEHFYTSEINERDTLVSVGWQSEGVAWIAPQKSNTPVYRLYNPNSGEHHYTTSEFEKDSLVSIGWNDEGIGWYSDDAKGEPLFRLYNPNATGVYEPGAHHYTNASGERDYLASIGWNDEGIGWYGLSSEISNPVPSGFTAYSNDLATKDLGSYTSLWVTYHVVLVYNRSNEAKDVTLKDTSYNAAGTPIDMSTDAVYCLEPGKTMAFTMLHEDTNISSFQFTLTEDSVTDSVVQQYSDVTLTSTVNANHDKLIVTGKNNSSNSIEYTKVVAVFFNNGKLVNMDWGYIDLEKSKEDSREFDCYEEAFDNYEVYYTAYSYDYN